MTVCSDNLSHFCNYCLVVADAYGTLSFYGKHKPSVFVMERFSFLSIFKTVDPYLVLKPRLTDHERHRLENGINTGLWCCSHNSSVAHQWGRFITARKRSLGQGNIFRSVCQEFCLRGASALGEVPAPAGVSALGGAWSGGSGCLVSGGCLLRGCLVPGGCLVSEGVSALGDGMETPQDGHCSG